MSGWEIIWRLLGALAVAVTLTILVFNTLPGHNDEETR